jgi:hypothetical protein
MIRKSGYRFSLGTKRGAFCPEIMLKQKILAHLALPIQINAALGWRCAGSPWHCD